MISEKILAWYNLTKEAKDWERNGKKFEKMMDGHFASFCFIFSDVVWEEERQSERKKQAALREETKEEGERERKEHVGLDAGQDVKMEVRRQRQAMAGEMFPTRRQLR